jgi:hypothetical protein
MTAEFSMWKANLKWQDDEGMQLIYRLNRTGEIIPSSAAPPRIRRQVDVTIWKDALNV